MRAFDPPAAFVALLVTSLGLGAVSCGDAGDSGGASAAPNVLIVMWDTVRGDRLSGYGYPRPTTPCIDALARRSRVFTRAISTSNWTVPSHASIFTGSYPERHGALGAKAWLDEEFDSLAEILTAAGYETWAFSANPYVSADHNLTQGFATVLHPWEGDWLTEVRASLAARPDHGAWRRPGHPPRTKAAPVIRDALLAWLDVRDERVPFCAFVNLMEAHWPWHPTRTERSRFLAPDLVDHSYAMDHSYEARYRWTFGYGGMGARDVAATSGLYDAALMHLDRVTGQILDGLGERGLLRDLVLVIVGDHGDNLGDHDLLGHEYSLHESLLSVPLIVRAPGLSPGLDRDPAQSVDLFATVIELVGLPVPPAGRAQEGLSLADDRTAVRRRQRPLVGAYLAPKHRAVDLVGARRPDLDRDRWLSPIRSFETDGWKLIRWDDGRRQLFHLTEDPGERRDLARREPERVLELEAGLETWVRARRPAERTREAELNPAQLERLKSLGYVGDAAPDSTER